VAQETDTLGGLTPEVVVAAFGLAPVDAIRFFQRLGLSINWDWRTDLAQSREIAFTLAGVTDLQVLAAVRDEVLRALQTGITQDQFRRFLAGRLADLGWLGDRIVVQPDGTTKIVNLARADRMNTIYRTNLQTAYMAGRYEAQVANADAEPYWQYIAILDDRTRPGHAAMNGRVYKWNDAIWKKVYPPCGYNCRCRVRTLTLEQVNARGLLILDGAVAPLPPNFPDKGFGHSAAANDANWQNAIATAGNVARDQMNGIPDFMRQQHA
jgi:SPP1 gp7 family putative phage head morphogenesis protein